MSFIISQLQLNSVLIMMIEVNVDKTHDKFEMTFLSLPSKFNTACALSDQHKSKYTIEFWLSKQTILFSSFPFCEDKIKSDCTFYRPHWKLNIWLLKTEEFLREKQSISSCNEIKRRLCYYIAVAYFINFTCQQWTDGK